MRRFGDFWLSIAAPCLVVLALSSFFFRKDNNRVQSIPSLVIGIGLTCSSFIGRNARRKKLLNKIIQYKE